MANTIERALISVTIDPVIGLLEGSEAVLLQRDMKESCVTPHLLLFGSPMRAEVLGQFKLPVDHHECFLYLEREPANDPQDVVLSFDMIIRAAKHLCGGEVIRLPEEVGV